MSELLSQLTHTHTHTHTHTEGRRKWATRNQWIRGKWAGRQSGVNLHQFHTCDYDYCI